MSEAQEVGQKLVAMCKQGDFLGPYKTLYSPEAVSVEGMDTEEMPAASEGMQAIMGKASWWEENHEVHSAEVTGPFVGLKPDQFVVKFDIDVTNKPSGQRSQMSEVGLYTVKDGKVLREEFLYLME